jgi:hypothetical protein
MKKLLVVLLLLFPTICSGTILGTLAKLREAAQDQIDFDVTASDTLLIPEGIWNRFVNRGCVRVSYDAKVLYKKSTFVTAAGTRPYLVDTALLDVEYIVKVRNRTIRPVIRWYPPFMETRWPDTVLQSTTHSPNAYWLYGDSIYFWPTPTRVDTMLVGYTIYPSFLSVDASVTNLSLEHREAVVWYTCYQALFRLGRFEEAVTALQRYNEEIGKYIVREEDKFDILRVGK